MTKVPFVCNPKAYQEHYGAGLPTFQGEVIQHGYGLGNIISGLLRSIVPLAQRHVLPVLKKTAEAAGSSLLKSGVNVVKDVALEKKNLKESLKRHAKTSLEDLLHSVGQDIVAKQKGRGFKCKNKRIGRKKAKDIFT